MLRDDPMGRKIKKICRQSECLGSRSNRKCCSTFLLRESVSQMKTERAKEKRERERLSIYSERERERERERIYL